MNKKQEIKDLPAILFPHAYLPEPMVKKILSFFGPITIFQPWFMERPIFASEADDANAVHVIYPPSDMKPSEDFKIRLSEYRHWIENNVDKGYTAFLRASQETDLSENSTWEIRQMIRRMGEGLRPTLLTPNESQACRPEPDSLKWHLILHLAQEVEEERREADSLLTTLKDKEVPLKGIIEESDEVKSVLEDLPPFESEPVGDEYHLRQIFKAWFALFGGYLRGNEFLVTSNRHVMDYVTGLRKESQIEEEVGSTPGIRFKFPDLSHRTLKELDEIKRTRLDDKKIIDLKNLMLDFGKNEGDNLSTLEELSKEVEPSFPWELAEGTLDITIKHLTPIAESDHLKTDSLLKHLSNKRIVLVEQSN